MKAYAILAVAVGAAALTVAAPVPQSTEKPAERWEYGEVTFTPAGRAAVIRFVAPAGGNVPAPPPAVAARAMWVTSEEEVEAGSWDELATKLKAAEGPKSDNPSVHKMRVLNHLGRQGWEMVSAAQPLTVSATTVSTFVFKRKASK